VGGVGEIKALTLTLSRRERGKLFVRQDLVDGGAPEITVGKIGDGQGGDWGLGIRDWR
jgi:hypothetical protein